MFIKRLKYYILILFFLVSMENYSHGMKEPPSPKPNGPGPYPELPIDGGVALLLLIGTGYGVFKLKKK
mgnify:CR=1 FL=1